MQGFAGTDSNEDWHTLTLSLLIALSVVLLCVCIGVYWVVDKVSTIVSFQIYTIYIHYCTYIAKNHKGSICVFQQQHGEERRIEKEQRYRMQFFQEFV